MELKDAANTTKSSFTPALHLPLEAPSSRHGALQLLSSFPSTPQDFLRRRANSTGPDTTSQVLGGKRCILWLLRQEQYRGQYHRKGQSGEGMFCGRERVRDELCK
jgi:hypothetical protein